MVDPFGFASFVHGSDISWFIDLNQRDGPPRTKHLESVIPVRTQEWVGTTMGPSRKSLRMRSEAVTPATKSLEKRPSCLS
jgi:hypothetical protein